MEKLLYSLSLILFVANIQTQSLTDTSRHEVLLEADSGNIHIQPYNETPRHRDNFLKLVRSGAYNGVLFHRVIKDFMMQSDDMASKTAKPGQALGDTPKIYLLFAEINYPKLLHRRDAVAAVRESGDINPKRESSASQFYIVWRIKFPDGQLGWVQERPSAYTDSTVQITPKVRQIYEEAGGTSHLDGQYTVSEQVLEGLDVVEHIQRRPVGANGRPLTDVHVRRVTVLR